MRIFVVIVLTIITLWLLVVWWKWDVWSESYKEAFQEQKRKRGE